MKRLFLVVTLVSMSLFAKVNAAACTAAAQSFREANETARAIFIGEVVKIKPLTSYLDGNLEIMRYRVTFKVEYSWRGAGFRELGLPELVVMSEQILRAPEPFASCLPFPSFREGSKYLVFANETKDKSLVVGLGNATKPLWNASDDLKELRQQEAYFQYRVAHPSSRMRTGLGLPKL